MFHTGPHKQLQPWTAVILNSSETIVDNTQTVGHLKCIQISSVNQYWPDKHTYYIINITYLKAIDMNSLDCVVWYPRTQSFHSEFCLKALEISLRMWDKTQNVKPRIKFAQDVCSPAIHNFCKLITIAITMVNIWPWKNCVASCNWQCLLQESTCVSWQLHKTDDKEMCPPITASTAKHYVHVLTTT